MGNSEQGHRGILFMLVGPGGVGKNAIMQQVLSQMSTLKQLPTATTRAARPGESHGIHHFFVSLDEFQHLIETNALLEYQEVHKGKFYGVPQAAIEELVANRQCRIADIEFKGATIIRTTYPENSLAIFVAPPTYDSLITRLKDRKASQEQIDERLARVCEEMLFAPTCDYLVVNDEMEQAVNEICAIIQAAYNPRPSSGVKLTKSPTFSTIIYPVFDNEVLVQLNHHAPPPCHPQSHQAGIPQPSR